ncbi:MAG: hypothetical protein FJX75_26610 [Armatimonadetes bacterium]|nr:hypothetical protein [Armatimonadota bacterium]
MRIRGAVLLTIAMTLRSGWSFAATLTVTTTGDSGPGTLRAAMETASTNGTPDTITFAAALKGTTIAPASQLPYLTEGSTTIDGDLDDDGAPDITLDGINMGTAYTQGLYVSGASDTIIGGLSIVRFGGNGVYVSSAPNCRIEGCYLGVARNGTTPRPNTYHQVYLQRTNGGRVGAPGKRNVIASPSNSSGSGIRLYDTKGAVVGPNYIGINAAGTAVLGAGDGVTGVWLDGDAPANSQNNVVRDTVFAGMRTGIFMYNTSANHVRSCTFGLAADGSTSLPMGVSDTSLGMSLQEGALNNLIGGSTADCRNTFACGPTGDGIVFSGSGAQGNRVEGNYFGTNAAGTQQRDLAEGVRLASDAGAQTIGGSTASRVNFFAMKPTAFKQIGVEFQGSGGGTVVRNNCFGVLPATGAYVASADTGVYLSQVPIQVLDNTFARLNPGISVNGAGATPSIFRNAFRRCEMGVGIWDGACPRLGNLRNASARDDGGNVFRSTGVYHIANNTPNPIQAEGNDFSSGTRSVIDAKILDRLDDGALGRVDFDPLEGGVHPTGETSGEMLSAAAAIPAGAGAEVVYTLSAPAEVTVTVRNLAGRPIATVLRDRDTAAGLQRNVWSGCADNGLRVPAGAYVIEIAARSADGTQARALTTVRLGGR